MQFPRYPQDEDICPFLLETSLPDSQEANGMEIEAYNDVIHINCVADFLITLREYMKVTGVARSFVASQLANFIKMAVDWKSSAISKKDGA